MMLGMPGAGLSGSLLRADEPEAPAAVPELVPTLPVVDGEPLPLVLLEPSVPVVCGTPALPTPVPKFGVTVVLPGPGPPGTPTPDGFPGWPAVAPPGEVLPTLPLEVPVPLAAPLVPPAPPLEPPPCANANVEKATSAAASTGVRVRIGSLKRIVLSTIPAEASFRQATRISSGAMAALQLEHQVWCGREETAAITRRR